MTRKRIEMKAGLRKPSFPRFLSVPAKTAAVMLAALLLLAGAAHAYTITVNPYPPLGPLGAFVIPNFAGGDTTGVYSIDWGDGTTAFQFYNTGSAVHPVVSHQYAAGGTYTVSFVYTGGGPTVTDTITLAGPPDTVDPTVTILNPATDPFASAVPVVTVTGTAADNVGVAQVTWRNTTTGASGAAAGTNAWTAAGIPLQPGTNTIRIRAADAAGNTGIDSVTVNYTPATPARQGATGATVTASPAVGTLIPGRDNVFSATYRASGTGSFRTRSSKGMFETAGGRVLFTVNKPVEIRAANGLGLGGETVTIPASVIQDALDRGENRIFYRRTFTGAVQTEVTFQVLPASAGPLSIKRMELNFLLLREAGGVEKTPRATVPRNSTRLRAVADLQYDGGGTLRGVWKVDGQILGYTTKELYRGIDTESIESPPVPPLPTYATGRHSVTFEIEAPAPGFDEPVIYYYVSERAGGGIAAELLLISPAPDAVIAMPTGSANDPVFSWQPYPQQGVYRFEIVSPLNPKVAVVEAMTGQTTYGLSRYNADNLQANADYLWRVVALAGGTPVAASSYRSVIFTVREGRPGGLSLTNFTVTDETGTGLAGEGGGPRPLYRVPTEEPVRVSAMLENGSGREMKNVTVQVLVDGALYDALFFPVLAPGEMQEVFTDLELEEARRQMLQVRAFEDGDEGGAAVIGAAIEAASGAAGEGGATGVSTVRTDILQMTGLSMGAPMVRTENLQMTGMATGASIVHTDTLQMTGLSSGAAIVRTDHLTMTGMASGASILRTDTLQMTGLSTGASMVRTEKLQMTGLNTGASIIRTETLQMTGFSQND
jgi:hypothetical protein